MSNLDLVKEEKVFLVERQIKNVKAALYELEISYRANKRVSDQDKMNQIQKDIEKLEKISDEYTAILKELQEIASTN